MMINRSSFLSIALPTTFYLMAGQQPPITLNPLITCLIDGQSFGVHGELIGAMYKIVRDVQALQLGRRTREGRIGLFKLDGQIHSIKTLAEVEKSMNESLSQPGAQQDPHMLIKQEDLKILLAEAKQNFISLVAPFFAHARGAKEPIFMLISESCSKRNRADSLLLNWAKSSEDEIVSFNKVVTSFALFDEFCSDLINFLGDLVASCPKARAQFEQLKQDYIHKHSSK